VNAAESLKSRFQSVLDSMDSGGTCPPATAECLRSAVRKVMGCPDGCPYISDPVESITCDSCGAVIQLRDEEGG
jgi:hypothetical protein